jgi:16S rRNA processing protein RimM
MVRRPARTLPSLPGDPADLVLVGAVIGAFGLKGDVRVRAFTADPQSIADYGALYDADGRKILTPQRVRLLKAEVALWGPECPDRTAAERLKGVGLHVPRARLPELAEDEFYHVDLLGLEVRHADGRLLGRVRQVVNYGAGDLLEIDGATGGEPWLCPLAAGMADVDLEAGRVTVDPPDGLMPEPLA